MRQNARPVGRNGRRTLDPTKDDDLGYGGLKEKGVAGAQGGRERVANRMTRCLRDLTLL